MKNPPAPKGTRYVEYNTRNFRVDLLDRLRVVAAMRRATIEHVLNLAVKHGLPVLEAEVRGKR